MPASPLPKSNSPLATFNARTMKTWLAKRLRFRIRLNLNIAKVVAHTKLTVAQRVKIAGQFLRDAVVVNLSRPVRKYKSKRTGRTVVDAKSRSKPGEFPRADTTRLMKDIFHRNYPEQALSRVGTTLKYGAILELRRDRSFLRKTVNQYRRDIFLIVSAGKTGGP